MFIELLSQLKTESPFMLQYVKLLGVGNSGVFNNLNLMEIECLTEIHYFISKVKTFLVTIISL
jgi:uncharacterized protein YfkK (UPF0435 family)